jgi:hypothetical protein
MPDKGQTKGGKKDQGGKSGGQKGSSEKKERE